MAGDIIDQVDPEIQPLVRALRAAGLDSDWSCAGETSQDMCIRPTVQMRTYPFTDDGLLTKQRCAIEQVMAKLGVGEYWLSLVFTYGKLNSHGGEPTWLLQIPGRFDYLSLPAGFSAKFTVGKQNLVENYCPIGRRLVNGR